MSVMDLIVAMVLDVVRIMEALTTGPGDMAMVGGAVVRTCIPDVI